MAFVASFHKTSVSILNIISKIQSILTIRKLLWEYWNGVGKWADGVRHIFWNGPNDEDCGDI